MLSFLLLPQEIREYIIEHVLCVCHTPPTYPSKSGRIDFHDISYKAWRSRTKIYHEQRSTHCPSNCLPLLLTSRQMHDETQSVLNRKKSKLIYILDISVLNDYDLFPTWISVPYLTNRVYSLYTDVRLFGSIIPSKIAKRLRGDGGRLGFHWSFYALLERFLRYGPVDEKKKKPNPDLIGNQISDEIEYPLFRRESLNFDDRDITVEILTLDFQSAEPMLPFPPDNISYNAWQGQHFRDLIFDETDNPIELERYRTRPEWLAKYLLSQIHGLLTMSYHFASYGKILYERVGTIRILSPEGVTEIDLATELAALRFTNQQDTFGDVWHTDRLSTFWKWKKQTLVRRQELGFPVLWPQDPELEGLM